MVQGSEIKDGEGNAIGYHVKRQYCALKSADTVNTVMPHNLRQQTYNTLKMSQTLYLYSNEYATGCLA